MNLTTVDEPGGREQLAMCREFARMAKVERTYAVVPDPNSSKAGADLTNSFAEAYAMIRNQTAASLSVIFDWKSGGKTGSDSIRFFMPHATATERYVEQTIDNLIAQKITSVLYKDYEREDIYSGPISIIDDVN